MSNQNIPVNSPNASYNQRVVDLGGGVFAPQQSSLPGLAADAGKVLNLLVTLNASAGTVTVVTLPANVIALRISSLTALANVVAAFGADTALLGTSATSPIAANAFKAGVAVESGKDLQLINVGGNTALSLVADVNSAKVLITAQIGG